MLIQPSFINVDGFFLRFLTGITTEIAILRRNAHTRVYWIYNTKYAINKRRYCFRLALSAILNSVRLIPRGNCYLMVSFKIIYLKYRLVLSRTCSPVCTYTGNSIIHTYKHIVKKHKLCESLLFNGSLQLKDI